LSDEAAMLLDELRAFRHVFRNLYQTGIKPNKITVVQEIVHEAVQAFNTCSISFLRKLQEIVEE
jgi:hypothetical protein